VELGFINALVEMFEEEEILEENTAERIKQDLALAARPLRDTRGFSPNFVGLKKCFTFFVLGIRYRFESIGSVDPGLRRPNWPPVPK
jgi:hypothetical protein